MATFTPATLLLRLAEQHTRLNRKLDRALSLHGINFTEFTALKQLHGAPHEQMRRIDLAQRIGLSASGVTRLLGPMEKIGLVAKLASERDARVRLVTLTEAGQRVLAEAETSFTHFANDTLHAFTAKERNELARLIGKLR